MSWIRDLRLQAFRFTCPIVQVSASQRASGCETKERAASAGTIRTADTRSSHLYSEPERPQAPPFPGPRPSVSPLTVGQRLQLQSSSSQAFRFTFTELHYQVVSPPFHLYSRPETPGSRAPFPGPRPSVSALQWAREAPGSGASFPGPRPFVSPLQWARGSRPKSFISTAGCRVSPHQLAHARCETKSLLLAVLSPEPACQWVRDKRACSTWYRFQGCVV